LKLEDLKVAKFLDELIINLRLDIRARGLFNQWKDYTFDETISYDPESRLKFRDLLVDKEGYFSDVGNYFYLDNTILDEYTKLATLRNSRVSVYWREISLTDEQIDRIITLGFGWLIDVITKAELVVLINQVIKNSTYEIKALRKPMVYVMIGIEGPIFKF